MPARRQRLLVVLLVVALGLVATGWLVFNRSGGRTPSSEFVRKVFPDEPVLLDRTYDSGGSSEDKSRTVAIRTEQTPDEVISVLLRKDDWRRLGAGVLRESDGLCVVPWTTSEFVRTHAIRGADVEAAVGRRPAIILSLLYC